MVGPITAKKTKIELMIIMDLMPFLEGALQVGVSLSINGKVQSFGVFHMSPILLFIAMIHHLGIFGQVTISVTTSVA